MHHFRAVDLVHYGCSFLQAGESPSLRRILKFSRWQSTTSDARYDKPVNPEGPPEQLTTTDTAFHYISTLDPEKLTADDIIDLSDKPVGLFAVRGLRKPDGLPQLFPFTYPGPVFPPRTRGFLYLSRTRLFAPPTTYDLRFRITHHCDPTSFRLGIDLHHAGLRWAMPLVYGALWNPVVMHLVRQDALLDDELLERYLELKRTAIRQNQLTSRIPLIVARNQPFLFDFSTGQNHVVLLGRRQRRDVMLRMWIPAPCEDYSDRTWLEKDDLSHDPEDHNEPGVGLKPWRDRRNRTLYEGTALVRFERSTLPEHRNYKAMVIRIVRVLTPIVPRPHVPMRLPVIGEGSFLPIIYGNEELAIWSWPGDERATRLLDIMPTPGYYDTLSLGA